MKSLQAQTHYEILEISVNASVAEVRSAYERLTHLYSDDQVVLYGLVDTASAVALRARLKTALDVLLDDRQREAYDALLGLPSRVKPPSLEATIRTLQSRPIQREELPTDEGARSREGGPAFTWITPASPPPSQPASYSFSVPFQATPAGAPAAAVPQPGPSSPPSPRIVAVPQEIDQAAAPPPSADPAVKSVIPEPVPSAPRVAAPPTQVAAPPPSTDPAGAPVVPEATLSGPEGVAEPPTMADEDLQVSIVASPVRTASREFRAEPRVRPYEVPDGVEINGDLLKQVRMARGLSLVQLSDRTRISVKHLENVEGDRYDALPAVVYLRGILMNLAKELGLDGLRVSRSYLAFVEAHRSKD